MNSVTIILKAHLFKHLLKFNLHTHTDNKYTNNQNSKFYY